MDWSELVPVIAAGREPMDMLQDFLGYQHRPLGWRHPAWMDRKWHHILLVDSGEIRHGPDLDAAVGPGDCLLRSPALCTPVHFLPDVRYWEIWFRFPQSPGMVAQPGLHIAPACAELRPLLETCLSDWTLQPGRAGRLGLALLLERILVRTADRDQGLAGPARIRLHRWVRAHLADRPTPAQLAAVLGFTSDYFTRVFRRSYGMPPRQWLAGERIRAVARALSDQGAAADIQVLAEAYGFSNPSHFARQFRAVLGESPARWRRRHATPATRYADADRV